MAKLSAEEIKLKLSEWFKQNQNISEIYTEWEYWSDDEGSSGLQFSVHIVNADKDDTAYDYTYVGKTLYFVEYSDYIDSFGSQEIVIENPFHKEWLESQLKGNNKHVKGRLKI